MDDNSTVSVQQVRQDPVSFLKSIKNGKTLTVIYHSRPLAVVTSADRNNQAIKNTQQLLSYASKVRSQAKDNLNPRKSFKELYDEDMTRKYGLS